MLLWLCFASILNAVRRHTPGFDDEWTTKPELWDPVVGVLMAFGDFNNDHSVDALFLENDNQIRLYAYDRDHKKMRQYQFKSPTPFDVNTGFATVQLDIPPRYPKVKNIIPVDANFDGFLDVLVIYGNDDASRYQYQVLQNDATSELEFKHKYTIPGEFVVEPLIADLNMDGIPDLLTQNSETIQVVVSERSTNGSRYDAPRNWSSMFDVGQYADAKLRSPHGSAIIDIDGDCTLDIALVLADGWIRFFSSYSLSTPSKKVDVRWRPLQVYDSKVSSVASMDVRITDSGHPVFVDVDADGTNDILYPTLDNGYLHVWAIYNKQQPICRSPVWRQAGCRDSKEMCRVCDGGICDNVKLDAPAPVFIGKDLTLKSEDLRNLWLRTADYDNDMFPDILVHSDSKVCVLGGGRDNATEAVGMNCRPYDASKVWRSTFFDSGPHFGWKNILIQTRGDLEVFEWTAREASDGHTYHLTTSGLSGVCVVTSAHGCPASVHEDDNGLRKDGYGQNYPGFMFKLALTNFQGYYIPRVATQLAQQTYGALQEPNVHFGLKQCNNYVAELFTALTVPPPASCLFNKTSYEYNRQNCPFYRHWVGSAIIPNTALRVIPYRRSYPHEWEIELEVSPAKDMVTILLVSSGVLVALGGLIMFNEYRDRKKQEKRQYRDFRVHFIG